MFAPKAQKPAKAQAKAEAPKSKSAAPPEKAKNPGGQPAAAAFNPRWARMALGVQPKLRVTATDDPAEAQADRIADRVMHMPDPMLKRKCAGGSDPLLSRPSCEDGPQMQRRSSTHLDSSEVDADFTSRLGAGTPLDSTSRAYFEPRFGHDFGNVRIHTGAQADVTAASIQARAFTLGRDVVFAAGEHDTRSASGQRLLAHELTHVVQQGVGGPSDEAAGATWTAGQKASPDLGTSPLHATSVGVARDVGFARRGPISDPYGMGYNDIYRRAGASSLAAVNDLASCEGRGMTFNQASFEALPTARRTAVLGLRPHAAGTACDAWFQTLGRSTSGGEFQVDTYAPHASATGDTDKFVGTEIKLRFTPSLNTISDKIGFVQILRPIGLLANEVPRATQTSDGQAGWALDRVQGRRSPIYGQDNSGNAAGNTHFGFRRSATDMDPAWIYDKTNEQRLQGQSLAFEGTTYALDATHNTYLGGVHWGFDVSSAGAVTTRAITIQSLIGPEGIQRRALELWNVQAANPNPALRNDPQQDQVPVP
jgi:hypothetical protein